MESTQTKTSKKKILVAVVGGICIVALSAMLTYSLLYALYDAQTDLKTTDRSVSTPLVPKNEREIVARSHRDFGAVCSGYTVLNAAKTGAKKASIIATFSQSPRDSKKWSYEDVGFGKPYTKTNGDFTKINTVACLHEIANTKVFAKECPVVEDGVTVVLKYHSVRYKMSYYEPLTGKRIADGGIVEAPADICPTFASYDQQTLAIYADPQHTMIEAEHTLFMKR